MRGAYLPLLALLGTASAEPREGESKLHYVMRQLNSNPEIAYFVREEGFLNSSWEHTIDIWIAPTRRGGIFDADELQTFLHDAVTGLEPTTEDCVEYRGFGTISIGLLYFDEPIEGGTEMYWRREPIEGYPRTSSNVFNPNRGLFDEKPMRRTWVRAFPSVDVAVDCASGRMNSHCEHWLGREDLAPYR